MDSLDKQQYTPRDQGKKQGDYYLPLFSNDLALDAWMAFGENIVPHFQAEKPEQVKFLIGWQSAYDNRQLLIELLSDEDQVIAECTRLADRRKLIVERQTFHRARLCIGGLPPSHPGIYETTYDYNSPAKALNAMQTWDPERTPEPDGWTRHHDTGRYRIDGDNALEYVKDDGRMTLEQRIGYAVRATQGLERVIMTVEEHSKHIGSEMPVGTQLFIVTSQSATCTHDPRCEWYDHVYHYCDRSVVVGFNEVHRVKLGNVLQRLRGGKDHD